MDKYSCFEYLLHVATLIIAGCGVWVAWQGLKAWRKQLKGTSQFDIARKLMLKVYQIRQDIEYCRAEVRSIPQIMRDEKGNLIPEKHQNYYSTRKDMLERLDIVIKTYSEIELLLFESDIILDKKIRDFFKPIKDVCYELKYAISRYLDWINPDTQRDDDYYQKAHETVYSSTDDKIKTKVDTAVSDMEKSLAPYWHG